MNSRSTRSLCRPPLSAVILALFCLGGLTPAVLQAQATLSPFHVTRYEIDIELFPDVHELRARARLVVVADEPLGSLTLRLNRNLKVEQVLDARGGRLPFEQTPPRNSFRLELPQTLAPEQSVEVEVAYQGAFDPALRPKRGPVLATIAPGQSYLLRESRWFPQAENLWDRSAMTLSVTLPAGEVAVASGQVAAPETVAGGKTRTLFRVSEPTLAGTLIAGDYEAVESTTGAPVTFYLRSVPHSYPSTNAETLANIIAFFSDTFGPLAAPDVALVEIPATTWESYSAPGLLLLATSQWSSSINYRLLARGLSLQWWRNRTSPATADDAWLADGLARYSEALYVEHAASEEGLRQVLRDLTVGALVDESAAPIGNAGRLPSFSPEYNSIVRDKGAMVFHMLRQVIGDDAFFKLLADYSRRFAGHPATIDEFERLAEEISGQPLDYFFGEWLRSTGVPQFQLDYVIYRTQKGFRVDGEITHELEIFRMPVPIHIETEGPPVDQKVEVSGSTSDFSIETFGKPLRLEVDRDNAVLKYTPKLRLEVAVARGESLFQRGRYFEAIREYQRALEVKRNSSLAHYRIAESFFEQRNYQAAANSFREAVNGDREPPWTLVWGHIFLGKIFDLTGQRERAINEYRRALDTNDDSQGALAEAQKYLREPYRRQARTIERIEQIERR
ncbi:MAG: tetratricopeptide repeat protein [Terriglobia bacterium]